MAVSTAPRTASSSGSRVHPTLLLVAILGLLNLADLVTTRIVLDRGGSEGNPLMRPFVDGMWAAAGLKLLCLAAVGVLAMRCPRPRLTARLLGAVVVWYALVVVWNVVVLARAA